jgi:hypothetical protein
MLDRNQMLQQSLMAVGIETSELEKQLFREHKEIITLVTKKVRFF